MGIADPQYTMDFTDVEEGAYIYWCAACGPLEHMFKTAIETKLQTDPEFKEKLERAIDGAKRDTYS